MGAFISDAAHREKMRKRRAEQRARVSEIPVLPWEAVSQQRHAIREVRARLYLIPVTSFPLVHRVSRYAKLDCMGL